MGLQFLRNHGGQRLRQYQEQPILNGAGDADVEDELAGKVDLDLEVPRGQWAPLLPDGGVTSRDEIPQRFIDGCHLGHTVAWLQDDEGHPIPVMLAEIGGVCMRAEGRTLRRDFEVVERIVSMIADPFPWEEVEDFAIALAGIGLRLSRPKPFEADSGGGWALSYDFEAMRKKTQNRSNYEMALLEGLALCQDPTTPTVVDGRVEPRLPRGELQECPVVGVIKQQREGYLHPRGWQVFYGLEPGQRTPAFKIEIKDESGKSRGVPVVSWYLKLDGARGALPNWGVVRVELPARYFERVIGADFGYVSHLSRYLFQIRCRQAGYERGPVSLEPIVRAEESLKSLFTPSSMLTQQFYHATGL